MPYFDLTTYSGVQLFLTFDYAYARSDASFSDELIVLLSTDCGVNYKQVARKAGNSLATGPTQTTPFIPDSTQWREAKIFLGQYVNSEYVQIKIVNITDGGNNLYLDNINLGDFPTGMNNIENVNQFSVYPNPASSTVIIQFENWDENRKVNLLNSVGIRVACSQVIRDNQVELQVSELPFGMYFVQVESNGTRELKKLVIGN